MSQIHTLHKRIHQPIASATGLSNDRYVEQRTFIEDRDRVMGRGWASIAFVEDLPEKNHILPLEFMGLPLLVTRDKEDVIRVFHNVCSHRGMQLADLPCRSNGTIRCPYHSWTYQLDGQLRSTPHIGGFGIHEHDQFDRNKSALREVRSSVWLGLVFVNLSGDAEPFNDYIAPLASQFDALCTHEQRERMRAADSGCRTQLTVASNWKLAVENYLESYHLPSVHPELNRVSPLKDHFEIEAFSHGAGQGSLNYQRLLVDDVSLPAMDSWPEDRLNRALYPVLYPNTLIGLHADHQFVMMLQPIAPDQTVEHVRISYLGEEALDAKYAPHHEHFLTSWSDVFREDVFAVERMQKGRSSPGYTGGAFAPAMDGPTLHFHRWVADRLLEAEKAATAEP